MLIARNVQQEQLKVQNDGFAFDFIIDKTEG